MADIRAYLEMRACMAPRFLDGDTTLAFISTLTGTPQLWTLPVAGGFPEQQSFGDERIGGIVASPDGRVLVAARDVGGDERYRLYRTRPWRPLVDIDAIHYPGAFSPDSRFLAYTHTARNGTDFDLAIVDIETGERRELTELTGYHTVADWSAAGILLVESLSNVAERLHLVDPTTGWRRELAPHDGEEAYAAPTLRDDGSVRAGCDRGSEFARLATIARGELRFDDPDTADVELIAMTSGREAVVRNVAGTSRLVVDGVPVDGLPEGVITGARFSAAGDVLALAIAPADDTEDIWLLAAGAARRATRSSTGGVERTRLRRPVLTSVESFDGREIPYLLYGPADAPTLCHVHGGPESQARPQLNAVIQYLAERGLSVAVPNVRGSTGYGRTYTHLDDVERRLDSVADLAALARALGADRGTPVGVMGGSYGGYMTLAAITEYPDLFRAAVDIVGIANFVTFLENTGSYRRALREAEYGSLAHDRTLLERISPIHKVDRIRTPLFVVHGANDPRVPISEAEQIVEALRARGGVVEYLRYDDEGHGLVRLVNRLDAYPRIAAFLERHLLR